MGRRDSKAQRGRKERRPEREGGSRDQNLCGSERKLCGGDGGGQFDLQHPHEQRERERERERDCLRACERREREHESSCKKKLGSWAKNLALVIIVSVITSYFTV